MALPEHTALAIQRSVLDLIHAEIGSGGSALHDAMRPMLQRAFARGLNMGVEIAATANAQGIALLKRDLSEMDVAPSSVSHEQEPHQARRPRRATSGVKRRRAPRGAVGQAIDLVLGDKPGLRMKEIQELATELDATISRSSVTNELRRRKGLRYRQDGLQWFLIGDTRKEDGEGPLFGAEPDSMVGRSGLAAA
jgi:hypothetical protein